MRPGGHTATVEVRQTLGGRYKLLDELGSGGMAVVWRARDEVLGRTVAVKLLAGRFVGDPQSRARIRDEARAAATLSHPNIAQVYDYGEAIENGVPIPYVVMELVNGPTLQQRVTAGPLPPRTIFRICGEVAAALAAAHLDGLVHRDIKMANIMVTTSGAKVVDFGIAAAAGPAAPDEMLVGTPAYLAPERLTGAAIVPASDVYALGVLLYRLLTSESPWSVESTTQMLRAHIYVDPEPLPPLAGVPPAVADLIARCLRKDPASRPSANEVSAALGDAAEASDAVRGEAVPKPLRVPRPSDDLDAHTSEWSSPPNEAPGTGRRRRRRADSPDDAAAAAAAGGMLGTAGVAGQAGAHGPADAAAAAGSGAAGSGGEPTARRGPGGGESSAVGGSGRGNPALGGRGGVDPAHGGQGGVDPARGGSVAGGGSRWSVVGSPLAVVRAAGTRLMAARVMWIRITVDLVAWIRLLVARVAGIRFLAVGVTWIRPLAARVAWIRLAVARVTSIRPLVARVAGTPPSVARVADTRPSAVLVARRPKALPRPAG